MPEQAITNILEINVKWEVIAGNRKYKEETNESFSAEIKST